MIRDYQSSSKILELYNKTSKDIEASFNCHDFLVLNDESVACINPKGTKTDITIINLSKDSVENFTYNTTSSKTYHSSIATKNSIFVIVEEFEAGYYLLSFINSEGLLIHEYKIELSKKYFGDTYRSIPIIYDDGKLFINISNDLHIMQTNLEGTISRSFNLNEKNTSR